MDEHNVIVRKRWGRGFRYFYPSGRVVQDNRVLRRIERIVIPPQWRDVRIHRSPTADVQAIGVDAKGRRQFIYHPNWHRQQQQLKFARLGEFGHRIQSFRAFCQHQLHGDRWTQERSLALACLLLDHTGIRAGNRKYSRNNGTFGLTTLRRRHCVERPDGLHLAYTGKHSKPRDILIADPDLAHWVAQSAEQRGFALFRYEDEEGRWQDVDSDDVNGFIHQHMGEQFSCKDFRTWAACRYGLESLPLIEQQMQQNPRRKWHTTLVCHVAQMLGNTQSICQQYYLHPKLITVIQHPDSRQKLLQELDRTYPKDGQSTNRILATEKLLSKVITCESDNG